MYSKWNHRHLPTVNSNFIMKQLTGLGTSTCWNLLTEVQPWTLGPSYLLSHFSCPYPGRFWWGGSRLYYFFPGIVPEDYIVLMQKGEKKRKEKASLASEFRAFFFLGLIFLFIEHFEFFEISSTPIWQTHLVFWGQASAKCVLELTGVSLTHTAFLHLGTVSPSPDLENCGFHPVL